MSSMFHGASNIHISGSPTFTMINGGYHHYDNSTQVHRSQTANLGGDAYARNSFASSGQDGPSAKQEERTASHSRYAPTRHTGIRMNPYTPPAVLPASRSLPATPIHLADFQPWEVQQMDDTTREEMYALMSTLRRKIASECNEEVMSPTTSNSGFSGQNSQGAMPVGNRKGKRGVAAGGRINTSPLGPRSSSSSPKSSIASTTRFKEDTDSEEEISPSLSDEEDSTSAFHATEGGIGGDDQETIRESHSNQPSVPQPPVIPPHVVQMLRDLHSPNRAPRTGSRS